MKELKGKSVRRSAPKEAHYVQAVGDMVAAVNASIPGGEFHDWFASDPDARPAIYVKNGAYRAEGSAAASLLGGTVGPKSAENVRVCSYDGKTGGVFVEGAGQYEVNGAAIHISGDSTGIGGPACGAAVKNGGTLVLRNVSIDASGLTHYATAAERDSVLRVYDSVLSSHGAPFGEGQPQPNKIMATPPPGLMIQGNGRTHCTMTHSYSYFERCLITCDGWGALSTETAEGYAYLEAKNCRVVTVRRGYGAYADPGCHVVLDHCQIDSADMVCIVGGQGELILRDSDSLCGSCGVLLHSVAGDPNEISNVVVSGGRLAAKGPVAWVRSDNARLLFEDVELRSEENVLVRTQVNDDPLATPAGEDPYGVEVILRRMLAQGDVIREDDQRPLYLQLENAVLHGAVRGAVLKLDAGSRWLATGDSDVTLEGSMDLFQVDAPEGVTIRLRCAHTGREILPSGGVLELIEQ